MSISIEQVLADAKRLVERLRSHDTAADSLIQQTSGLNKRIETMTEFQEEVEEMNSIARHRPRTALILGIQRENRQIRQLQEENAELVASLKQHQAALDLIMSNYREQITKIQAAIKSENSLVEKHSQETHETAQYIHKILEMAAVMQRAADSDETYCYEMEATVAKLEYENRGLRELLRITTTVAKAAVVPLSPPPTLKATRGGTHEEGPEDGEESPLSRNDETVIINSHASSGASSRVEICEDSLAGESVADNSAGDGVAEEYIVQERVGSPVESRTLLAKQGCKGGSRDNHIVAEDTGGGGGGGGPTVVDGTTLVFDFQDESSVSGAIAKHGNVNRNNNKESSTGSSVSGPRGGVSTDSDAVSRANAPPTNCDNDADAYSKKKGNLANNLPPTESSSEEYDTLSLSSLSSVSSQSSVSTVKEADSISITGSEFSDGGGGDGINERFIDHEMIGVDSTHL